MGSPKLIHRKITVCNAECIKIDYIPISKHKLLHYRFPVELPSAAVLVFFAGAAGAGIVSADFGRGADYLDVFRLAAGTHRGAALPE